MGLSFKQLAEQCISAENTHWAAKKEGEPTFNLTIEGKRSKGKIKLLSGMRGQDLCGQHLKYVVGKNKTIVCVRCVDLREFFSQIGFSPESLIEKNYEASIGLH